MIYKNSYQPDPENGVAISRRSVMDVFFCFPHPDIELDLSRSKETLRDVDL